MVDDNDYIEILDDGNHHQRKRRSLSSLDISIHSCNAPVQYANPTQVQLGPPINLTEIVKTEILGPAHKSVKKKQLGDIRCRCDSVNNNDDTIREEGKKIGRRNKSVDDIERSRSGTLRRKRREKLERRKSVD